MANKISVDTTEIMALKSNLKTNIGSIIKNHKSKKQSVYSRMQQVMNEYSDCYEIYSQASAIIALLDEADAASKRIEPLYEQIISGLEYTISSTKQCERDIKKLLGIEKPEISKIRDRNTRTVRSRGLSKDSDLIEEAIEEEGKEATIETWGKEELKEIQEDTLLFGRKTIDATSPDLQINREALETVKTPTSLSEMSFQKEGTHPKINLASAGYAEAIEKKRLDKISTYTSLLNQSVKEGKGEPQWLLDALAAIGFFGGELLEKVADEIEARKKQEEERLKDIQNYADLLNEYRRTGRGEPQWLLDKLEELGAPYGVIDWQTVAITINGVTIPSIQATQNLSSESCDKYIKTLLEDLNGTIEDAWGISALNFEGDINDKEVYELAVMQYLEARDLDIAYELLGEQDESKRDQILLYWLLAETKGKSLKEEPMPDWWLQESKKALENLEVLEEDFKNSKVAAFDYYFKYQYMVDIVQNDGTPIICDHFFEKWFEEQYGHLDPKSHDIKRLKYEMSQGLTIDLRNEEGLYDNEETEAFKNARNLWLNLKGAYEDFWDSKAIFTNNNKILQKIIDKLKKGDKLGAGAFQNLDYEQLIIEGEYRQAKDFITRLEKDGAQVVKNEDGTMTITLSTIIAEGVTIDELQWGVVKLEDLPVKEYTITVDCFDYTGETYIDAKEFDKKYTEYQAQRFNDGSYLNDFTGMHNYSMYADEAMLRWGQIQDAYPDAEITFEQVMVMLRMEDERLALYKEQKTDSERIQDAGQGVVDLASIAFAIAGHPYISLALEGGNVVASGTRENYDEMYLRIMGICLFGAGEYLKYADTGTEALKVNTKAFSSLTAGEIKAITEEADLIRITMDSGKQLVYSRADLYVDDLIKLKKLEKLVASGKGSLLEQLIEVGFTVDDLADLGIKSADDLIKLGITSQDDLIKLGITNKDDLAKLGIHTGEEFNRLGIGSIDDFINGAGKTGYTGGRTQAELDDLARDPSHAFRIEEQGIKEREIGLELEERGDLGKIVRDTQENGGAEFIDTKTGKKWDVKSFESYPNGHTEPRKGAFTVDNAMKKINKEFNNHHNIIIDVRELIPEHIDELKKAIEQAGVSDKIIWYP